MSVFLLVIGLMVGLCAGRLWDWLKPSPCPRCAIRDAEQDTLWQLHSIEQQTTTQLMQAAQAATQNTQQPRSSRGSERR